MTLAQLYERAINWPSPRGIAATLVIASCLAAISLMVSFWKPRSLARVFACIGLGVFMTALYVFIEQTAVEEPNAFVTVKRYRHVERSRLLAVAALTIVPGVMTMALWIVHLKDRSQLRSRAPRHLKAGRKHFAEKNFDAALREYSKAIHAAPELAEGYCRRGLVYHELGKTEQAMTDLDRAIECDPRFPSAYLERAKLRTESGDFDGALSDFGHLMLIRANDPDSYLQRGVCLIKKGLLSDAIADFHRVLKLTNHSDYAEPAKKYLLQALEDPSTARQVSPNGAPVAPSPSEPRVEDKAF
jgi:tetratricopeptide (TPR) repeat protein